MTEIFHFAARSGLTARQNVSDFIELCRSHFPGSSEEWSSLHWPGISFSKLGTYPRLVNLGEARLSDDFVDFAKSWISYRQVHRPKKMYTYEMLALRAVERALLESTTTAEIWRCNIRVMDDAAIIVRNNFSHSTAYSGGLVLEQFADFLSSHRLAKDNLKDWRSPIPRYEQRGIQLGEDGNAHRNKRLPKDAALYAVAEIFAGNPQSPRDILTTSFVAMLMCAPSRGSEILSLPITAEVGPGDLGVDWKEDGPTPYGWRFYSAKNFEGDIKWIPESMVEIAKTAFNRIKELTEPGRQLAKWVENNPNKFYRHDTCPDVDEDQPLTKVQAAMALGFNPDSCQYDVPKYLAGRGLATHNGAHTLRSLWSYVMSRLPKDFPWLDKERRVRFSEALFCSLKSQAESCRVTNPVEFRILKLYFFLNELAPSKSGGHQSIFDRHGYVGGDGQRLRLTTHQPRHLLNTSAQRGGLPQDEIAKWSGRANPAQNRVYNHLSDAETISVIRDQLQSASPPPSVEVVKLNNSPVSAEQFLSNRIPAVHVTEFGFCVHDFVIMPCVKYRDCINCTEQICVKGDQAKLDRLKLRLSRLKTVLALAMAEAEEPAVGSDRWITHHQKTITHLEELIGHLSNEQLPDGSLVRLAGSDFSHIQRALSSASNKLILKA
ncbi:integrase [Pseudomonas sp. NFX15]|uniref:integrase n=1 Tax=Pseudomonas sp. NFX15 TaxID=2816958 RepID=UPI003B8D7676